MADRGYFGKHFVGMNVHFVEQHLSTATLTKKKVKERYSQLDEMGTKYLEAYRLHGKFLHVKMSTIQGKTSDEDSNADSI